MASTPDEVGTRLESLSYQPDQHISQFYIRLGQQLVHQKSDILATINQTENAGTWTELGPEWPEFLIGDYLLFNTETERSREELLNRVIRVPLARRLASDPNNPSPIPIMIGRLCKYTNKELTKDNLKEDEIQFTIDKVYAPKASLHLDFFHLVVRSQNVRLTVEDVMAALKRLPGDWKLVEPQETWPLTFFGCFPTTPFDRSEREREERLNREVRFPLKKFLEEKATQTILKDGDPNKPKVSVIFFRACKYIYQY